MITILYKYLSVICEHLYYIYIRKKPRNKFNKILTSIFYLTCRIMVI